MVVVRQSGVCKNKVVKSNITPQAESLVKSIYTPGEVFLGKPVNGMFSYRFARLDENGIPLFYDENNNILSEDDPEIEEAVYNNIYNLKYEGTRDPILSGGFNNVIRYKDFSLSFLFSFGLKNKVRLPEFAYNSLPEADQNANRKSWTDGENREMKQRRLFRSCPDMPAETAITPK